MENFPDQIFFKDKQSRFLLINTALAKRYEVGSPAEAVGKSDADFYDFEITSRPLHLSSRSWTREYLNSA